MILPILKYPDELLRQKSTDVPGAILDDVFVFQDKAGIWEHAKNMLDTMYAKRGVGLAAVQVGIPLRLLVIDVGYEEVQVEGSDIVLLEEKDPKVFVNPMIVDRSGEMSFKEGCLSVPGANEFVKRYKQVRVAWFDLDGKHRVETFGATEDQQLLSVCIQHEIDHLDGKLFIDRLSSLKKDLMRKKMEKAAV